MRVGFRRFELWSEVEGLGGPPAEAPPAEAAYAVALLPAMRQGLTLCGPSLSPLPLGSDYPRIQEVVSSFFNELHPIAIRPRSAVKATATPTGGAGTGSFMSLGLDSFFTFLRHREEVDHLVLVHGFDIELADTSLWERTRAAAQAVAEDTGTRLVCVRTNLRRLVNRHLRWDESHGAALAHVALLLTPWLRRVYLASSHHEDALFPYGSHPELDPLWSTERLDLVHDGCDTRRIDKARVAASEQVAMDHLRVCWKNPGGAYNCGHCRKCLLVRMELDAVGGLARCQTLPPTPRAEEVDAIDIWGESGLRYIEEIQAAYREKGRQTPLLAAIDRAIVRERTRLGWEVERAMEAGG